RGAPALCRPACRARARGAGAERGRGALLRGSCGRRRRAASPHAAARQRLLPDRARTREPARLVRGRRAMSRSVEVELYRLAHARTGDKGNRLNIAVVCRDPAYYPVLATQLTSERVARHFAARKP